MSNVELPDASASVGMIFSCCIAVPAMAKQENNRVKMGRPARSPVVAFATKKRGQVPLE